MNESTVANKQDLEWPSRLEPAMVLNVARLWLRETLRTLGGLWRGKAARADHQEV